MNLARLSVDCLRNVCLYLEVEHVAALYASNNRLLMSRLVSPGIYPSVTAASVITQEIARFITGHVSLKEFSCVKPSMDEESLYKFPKFGPSPVSLESDKMSLVHPRLIFALPRTLKSLSMPARMLYDSTLTPNATTDFASLFPHLKQLIIHESQPNSYAVEPIFYRLMSALPSKLELLALGSAKSLPLLSQLPPSITSLHVNHALPLVKLAGNPVAYPSLELVHRLDDVLPNLRELSLPLLVHPRDEHPDLMTSFKKRTVLPHLETLNIVALEIVHEKELSALIESLPSVLSINLDGRQFEYGEIGRAHV